MSEYTDMHNNTYKITETILVPEEKREMVQEEVTEELYDIFMRK